MIKILKVLKFIIPVFILYLIFRINMIVGLLLIAAILVFSLLHYRYLIYYIKASKYYTAGKYTEAMIYFKKASDIGSCPDDIRHSYAFLLLKNKYLDEAEEMLNKMKQKKLKENVKYSVEMTSALVKWKKGNLNEAVDILEQVYKEFKCTTLYENLGYLLVLSKNYDRALQINEEAYKYNSSSKTICDNLGETYYYMGQYDKANEIYEALVNDNAKFIEAYYHYGLVLSKLGRREEALTNLNKALEFKENYLSEVNHNIVKEAIQATEEDSL
ncbi:tetratricopeptide repeat protein [Clostridium oryzae]|uniref:Tetratricopeptide repeat protein n=1 Tax=Clostridium oryzae TaxID=1450648 RepID=A0A1V4IKB8_9CLOT|nr:tetratricopeptide repeat protein [Clostridium oryzae]OPJ60376.1 tetratricopeptide repeat protein [Clostridium oryzae]